jgi:hypothetical protein
MCFYIAGEIRICSLPRSGHISLLTVDDDGKDKTMSLGFCVPQTPGFMTAVNAMQEKMKGPAPLAVIAAKTASDRYKVIESLNPAIRAAQALSAIRGGFHGN